MGAYCAIPPETYGSFTANSGSGFILGMAGSSTPSVYNRQSLALNSNSHLQIIGPVVLTVGIGMTVNSTVGNLDNPNWLEIRIASGGVAINSSSKLYAKVIAPSGLITINSNCRLIGNVVADRLVVNGSGILQIPQTVSSSISSPTIMQPSSKLITSHAFLFEFYFREIP